MHSIYLDNNATTAVLPEVIEAMRPYLDEAYGNPASQHAFGRHARRGLETARETVAELLDAEPGEVVFTSGGTEANNLAIFGLAGDPPAHLVCSAIEHPSITDCLATLARRGYEVSCLGVDETGTATAEALQGLLSERTLLVSVMLANNETGAIQPVDELAVQAATYGAMFHTDAVQAVGKLPVSFRQLGVTTLALSAHKFHGPKGVGALLVRRGAPLRTVLYGGHQQASLRPGTEPVALAVGLTAALRRCTLDGQERIARLHEISSLFWNRLRHGVPGIVLNGPVEHRLANTLNVSFTGIDASVLVARLDLAGVACSTGSACSSGSAQLSHVLRAMQLPEARVGSAVRFSLSALSTTDELCNAAAIIAAVVSTLGGCQPLADQPPDRVADVHLESAISNAASALR